MNCDVQNEEVKKKRKKNHRLSSPHIASAEKGDLCSTTASNLAMARLNHGVLQTCQYQYQFGVGRSGDNLNDGSSQR
jgi:hypothetical protein